MGFRVEGLEFTVERVYKVYENFSLITPSFILRNEMKEDFSLFSNS